MMEGVEKKSADIIEMERKNRNRKNLGVGGQRKGYVNGFAIFALVLEYIHSKFTLA